jgi:hypothetical protein
MSSPENPIPNPVSTSGAQSLSEIRGAIESLRGVFQVVALSGIVLSCTLLAFLYKETTVVERQNNELKNYILEYNTNVAPKIEMAHTNLEAFARTNPTMVPLLLKYFPTNAPVSKP